MPDFHLDFSDETEGHGIERELEINRSVYNEMQFSKKFLKAKKETSLRSKVRECTSKLQVTRKRLAIFILSLVPVLNWLPKYSYKRDLVRDMASGLTVGIMQIPQGMAYAMLTSLPPIYGLYVSFVPVLVYFIFGTSRHISLGTFAVVCLMNGEAIQMMTDKYEASIQLPNVGSNISSNSTDDLVEAYRVEVAVSLSLLVGLIQIFLGIVQLGFVTMYLSDPLVSGFTTGAAFHILSSQVRHFLGLTVPRGTSSGIFGLFKLYYYFFTHLEDVNVSALITGITCAILLYILKYLNQRYQFKFPIPAELIVVILGAGISYGAKFNEIFGTPILKRVPKGLPALTVPSFSTIQQILGEGFTIAIVSFAINVSLVKSFAKKNNYQIDTNQELFAYGLSNSVSAFFSCFPSAASLSRSLIQESLGSTQVTSLISVALMLLVLLALAPLFRPLPNAVLAAIVLVALKGSFRQFKVLKRLWKISKVDAFIWFTSFLAVVCLGVDYGLATGLVLTLLTVVARTSRPSLLVLGRIPGSEIYKPAIQYNVKEIPGVKVLQYTSSLYYANTEHFINLVSQQVPRSLETTEEDCKTKEFSRNGIENRAVMFDLDDSCSVAYNLESRDKPDILNTSPSTKLSVTVKRTKSLPTSLPTYKVSRSVNSRLDSDESVHSIVIDCSLFSYIDTMGVSTLGSIVMDFKKTNVEVYLASCSENVLSMLDVTGFFATHGRQRAFITVHDAVLHCLASRILQSRIRAIFTEEKETKDDQSDATDESESEDIENNKDSD